MKHLAVAQMESGLYKAVGVGVIRDANWPAAYENELNELNIPVYRAQTPSFFGTASFCYQFLRRPGIDAWVRSLKSAASVDSIVVHFHNAWMTGIFLPLESPRDGAANVVATFHGVNSHFENQPVRHGIHRWMAQRLLKYNARLTSVDGGNPAIAEKLFGLPRQRFQIIPNGISLGLKISCPFLRGSGEFVVGHVGSITDNKGWRIAAEAVLAVGATGRNVKLVIAGQGPGEPDVRNLSHEHPDTIIFKGFVTNPQHNVMPDLDLMAVMSFREGLPMTIIEAMSTGLPVAATNVGGIPEAVIDGETGRIIERTPERLADVIIKLYDNPGLLAEMSKRAHQVFLKRFNIDRIVSLYDRVYRNLQ